MDPIAAARDAFQQRLLAALFRGRSSGELVLKGGGAMRVLTQNARFTRDLDLDHDPKRSLTSLQNTIRRAIDTAFSGSGYRKLGVTEPKQTETVARWKIQAASPTGQEFNLTIEVSRRHSLKDRSIKQEPYQPNDRRLPRVYVDVYSESELALNKLRALLDENRTAPRDVYDLDLLLLRGERPSMHSLASLSTSSDWMDALQRKLDSLPWSLFEAEALPALPDEIRDRIDAAEYQLMKDRILDEIVQWTIQPNEPLS